MVIEPAVIEVVSFIWTEEAVKVSPLVGSSAASLFMIIQPELKVVELLLIKELLSIVRAVFDMVRLPFVESCADPLKVMMLPVVPLAFVVMLLPARYPPVMVTVSPASVTELPVEIFPAEVIELPVIDMAPEEVRELVLFMVISVLLIVMEPVEIKAVLLPVMLMLLPVTVVEVVLKVALPLRANTVLVSVEPLVYNPALAWIVSSVIVTVMNWVVALTERALLEIVVPPELMVSAELTATLSPEKFMLLTFSASLIRTVSFLNALVPFIVTEPLAKITVPPLKVQLVHNTFELTFSTTPGLRLMVQPLQEFSVPKADVLSLAVMLYVWP